MFTKTSVIENFLIQEIRSGNIAVGGRIPSRSQLCARFQCSRTVVEKAVAQLCRRGYLAGRKGSGTYVANSHSLSRRIKTLKILSDFNITGGNSPLHPDLNFDDLNISVDWLPASKALAEFEQLSAPGTAVIALRPQISLVPLLEKLKKHEVPVLLLNRDYDGFDCIITDPKSSIREGLSWLLIEAGRNIAFVSRRPGIRRPYIAERILSFYEAAIELGAHLNPDWCLSRNFNNFTHDIAEVGHKLFSGRKCPDGIFILDIDLVLPVVNFGQGYGYTPGKDYKLLMFDSIPALGGQRNIAMMKQPDLLYAKEIRRWLASLSDGGQFCSALKTELNIAEYEI